MQWVPSEVVVFLLITSCYSYPADIYKILTDGDEGAHFTKIPPVYHLRDVACIGNTGEIVEAVCCTTPTASEPWLVVLPTKRDSPCSVPDCSQICTSAIVASRFKRTFHKNKKRRPLSSLKSIMDYVDYLDVLNAPAQSGEKDYVQAPPMSTEPSQLPYFTFNVHKLDGISKNEYYSTPQKQNVSVKKTKTTTEFFSIKPTTQALKYVLPEATTQSIYPDVRQPIIITEKLPPLYKSIKVPSLVLEILQLCKHVERLNIDCPELRSMCKSIDVPVQLFLNSLLYCPSNEEQFSSTQTEKTELRLLNAEENGNCTDIGSGNVENTIMPCFTVVLSVTVPPFITEPDKIALEDVAQMNSTTSKTFNRLTSTKGTGINFKKSDKSVCDCKKNKLTQNERMKQLLMTLLTFPKPSDPLQLRSRFGSSYDSTEPPLISHYIKAVNVEIIVTDINENYRRAYSLYRRASWEYETNVSHFTRQKAMEAALTLTQFQMSMTSKLVHLTKNPIADPILARQIKLLYISGMNCLPEVEWNEFEQVIFGMQTVYTSASVNKWNSNYDKVTLIPEISDIMATSKNPEELKYYWIEWRNATGRRIRNLFEQYVSLMAIAAKKNGFHDASEMWVSHYESEDFFDSLNILWEDIRPLYSELHAYVRHKLHELYGDLNGATDCGKIPAHLTGDMWGQNWKNLYVDITLMKSSSSSFFSFIIDKFTKKESPMDIAKDTEKMFTTLGFTKFSKSFWTNSIFEKKNNTNMNCEASAWDFYDNHDFSKLKIEDKEEIQHLMSLCEYYKEYSSLPFVYRKGAMPGFHDGVAGAIVLSCKTASHSKVVKSYDEEIDGMLKVALEKVAFLPYSYIVDLWRHKVFRGEITSSNYNSKWWEFRSHYQGIKPPVERSEEDLDIASKYHISANKPYIKYFVSSLLEFQFHEALCKKANYTGPPHKCDFTTSAKAGKVLRKVMGLGASAHWKATIEELTGKRRLESAPLFRYFQPLYEWLREKNRLNKVTVGWDE